MLFYPPPNCKLGFVCLGLSRIKSYRVDVLGLYPVTATNHPPTLKTARGPYWGLVGYLLVLHLVKVQVELNKSRAKY